MKTYSEKCMMFDEENEVDVEFTYYKGFAGSREEPPEDPEIDICSVMFNGKDIYETISEEQMEDLCTQIWNRWNESDDYDYDID